MKVNFHISIELLLGSESKRFVKRFNKLCILYTKRKKGLSSACLKFAVCVGWTFYLAAKSGNMMYAYDLENGLNGNNEACLETGLAEAHLEITDPDEFENAKQMSYDIAMLLVEQLDPTDENQPFYDFLDRHVSFAYAPEVACADDDEPATATSTPSQPALAEPTNRAEQLSVQQLLMLVEGLLDVPIDANYTNLSELALLMSKMSGYKSETIRVKMCRGLDYDRPQARKDLEYVAKLIEHIKPDLAEKLRNAIL